MYERILRLELRIAKARQRKWGSSKKGNQAEGTDLERLTRKDDDNDDDDDEDDDDEEDEEKGDNEVSGVVEDSKRYVVHEDKGAIAKSKKRVVDERVADKTVVLPKDQDRDAKGVDDGDNVEIRL